jgi:arylsulfatase A-like enzyme
MKLIITITLAALALAALAIYAQAADAKKPNILIILADDLGYGELSMQGFTSEIPTPNIDALAKSGIRFTSGYVSGPYCSPTRAGLMTGRYQQRFGHEFNPGPAESAVPNFGLPLDEKTIGNRLKSAGYATGWFGKSHLGYLPPYHPLQRGFDEYFGFLGGAHDYLDASSDSHNPILKGTEPVNNIGYTTEAFAAQTVNFIDKHKSGEPWLCYLAFNAVHAPLEATDKYLSRFSNIDEKKRRTFAGMLSAMDDAVGSVMAKLRETGQEENTLVFFFSDNGGPTAQTTSGNGPLHGFKAQTWEGGIRVPWAMHWKGHIPEGQVDDRPVIQLDILPTALAAAGVSIQPEWKLDGVNLLPYVTGENKGAPHEALYWRFGPQIAIRKGDWKLVKAPGGGAEAVERGGNATTQGAQLYNLANDIGEKNNLAGKEPGRYAELAAAWNEWNKGNIAPKWEPGGRKQAAGGKKNAAAAAPAAGAASPQGPWKSGDTLSPAASPQVAGKPLEIRAQFEASAPDGVIVAQGGPGNGYALYLHEGKVALAVRIKKQLTTVSSSQPLPPGSHTVAAQLAADGKVTLTIDGQSAGEGKAPGLINSQPIKGLTVGTDTSLAIGEYKAPNNFTGKIENVTVKAQ